MELPNEREGFKSWQRALAEKIDVSPERQFVGFDAYKQVLESGVDVVLLTTPPHFRPMHLKAAIDAGLVNPDSWFETPSALVIDGTRFEDVESDHPSSMTVADIVRESSNVGTILVSKTIGYERLDLGVGRAVALDPLLAGEANVEWVLSATAFTELDLALRPQRVQDVDDVVIVIGHAQRAPEFGHVSELTDDADRIEDAGLQ